MMHGTGSRKGIMRVIDLTGQRFGRLTVVKRQGTSKDGQKTYLCRCDCGTERVVKSGNLRSGKTKSCGCLSRERTAKRNVENAKHGGCGSRLYGIWYDMRQRCSYEKSINWHLYGGRGIKVCDEWQNSFKPFKEWAIANGYEDGLQLDRIDNDGNYSPENCKWSTRIEQGNNRRTCVYVTIDGITKTVSEWCRKTGVNRMVAYGRIRRGWNPADAVTVTDPNVGRARNASSKFKPVIVDGEKFESIKSAAKHIGVNPSALSAALRASRQIGGHEVAYVRD
jgi:hypothetical protein